MKTEERFLWRAVFFLLLLLFFGTNVWELFGGGFLWGNFETWFGPCR
jgi:hypothetical protein